MNALLRKETRLLLPSFAGALVLAFSCYLVPAHSTGTSGIETSIGFLPFLLCPAFVLMMALNSFGSELTTGTFSQLLSQPVSRSRVWWTKTSLLGAALLIVLTVWLFCFHHHFRALLVSPEAKGLKETMLWTPVLYALVIFSGGLWTVLLLRQVAAAFWITLIVPAALAMMFFNVPERYPALSRWGIITSLILYSVAGFWFARRLFFRAQDLPPASGNIALPAWLALGERKAGEARRGFRPRRALWRKEFGLHQSHFVIAIVLALLHAAVIAMRRFGSFQESQSILFILEVFWALWLVMPLLIGCAAVAEERRIGLLEPQLCLPIARRTQCRIKLAVTSLLSLLFGVMVPLALEGQRILPDISPTWAGEGVKPFLPLLSLAGVALSIGLLSFYASTLTRNTLQALGPGVLVILLAGIAALCAMNIQSVVHLPLWRGPLVLFIGIPVMSITLLALVFWNFQHIHLSSKVYRRNACVLLLALLSITTVTASVYHRTWEVMLPKEPPLEAARIRPEFVRLKATRGRLAVEFANGKVWMTAPWQPELSGFIAGNNWAQVEAAGRYLVGLQKDGSLWSTHASVPASEPLIDRTWVREGPDNDWKAVASGGSQAFLLKTNGALWHWGDPSKRPWGDLSSSRPEPLGTDADWTEVFTSQSSQNRAVLRNAVGQTWVSPPVGTVAAGSLLPENLLVQRLRHFDDYTSIAELFGRYGQLLVGIHRDGTLRFVAGHTSVDSNGRVQYNSDLISANVVLNPQTNWLSLAGSRNSVVARRRDGTLWIWTLPEDRRNPLMSPPIRPLSRRPEWIGVAPCLNGVAALATDGSIWFWELEPLPGQRFLAFSRKPRLLANVASLP